MPANSPANAVLPREELALAVVEGENAVDGLIGDEILGDLPITWRNAHLVKATLADSLGMREISADKYIHAPGTRFERLTATFGDASVTVTPRGVELVIPKELLMDYRTRFDVMAFFCARFGNQISGLTKERLKKNAIFSTSNTLLGSATNSGVAYTVANVATSSYIADTIAATRRLKAAGEPPPYVQVMSGPVFERVRVATLVQAYVRGTLVGTTEVTITALAAAMKEFGIDKILIGDVYYNSGADGATTLSQVWTNDYIWTGKPGKAGATSSTEGVGVPIISGVGVNSVWEGYDEAGNISMDMSAKTFPGGNYVEVYPSNSIRAEVIRLNMSDKPTILNKRASDLIATQYA